MNRESIHSALESAADLYQSGGRPASFKTLAEATGLSEEALHNEFGTVDGPLVRYYSELVARCLATVTDLDPPTPEERVGAFAFVMLDLLEEKPAFVASTFGRYAAPWGSPFRKALGGVLGAVLESDDIPALNQFVLTSLPSEFVTVQSFVNLMEVWLDDDSKNRERSAALLDRVVRFYAELASNQTVSRGTDVLRYAVEAGYLPGISIMSDWLSCRSDHEDASNAPEDGREED